MQVLQLLELLTVVLGISLGVTILIKVVLYFKWEKQWNSITFLYFSAVDLKMTAIRGLKQQRKLQNTLTRIVGSLLLMLIFLVQLLGFLKA